VRTVRERIAATGRVVPSPVATFGFSFLAFAVAAATVRWANRRGSGVLGTGDPSASGRAPADVKETNAALGTTSTNRAPLSGRG
jgi:hypothetical protein